jgi:uncharacterized protein YjbI with pentapeptide repeats
MNPALNEAEHVSKRFANLNLPDTVLSAKEFEDCEFRDGNFTGADFNHTDFAGALFGRTRLTSVDFTEAVNYDIDVFNNDIRKAKFSRYEAVRLLDSLEIELVE